MITLERVVQYVQSKGYSRSYSRKVVHDFYYNGHAKIDYKGLDKYLKKLSEGQTNE